MTILLNQLINELNTPLNRYDRGNSISTVNNTRCVTELKRRMNEATSAYQLIQGLQLEIKNLEAKFWSFLPFVVDPIRELKVELERILSQRQYQLLSALETEVVELQRENQVLKERIVAMEQAHHSHRPSSSGNVSVVSNSDDIETLETQLRAEVEQEVKEEIETLRKKLLETQETNNKLAQNNKRLEIKCETYQKQTREARSDLVTAEGRISELTEENIRLKKLLHSVNARGQQNSRNSKPSQDTIQKDPPHLEFNL
jgi:chromosome segregation ATPase